MDANRFDSITQSLHDPRSRRGAVASLLGGTLGLLGMADTVAKKGKRKGKGKKKHQKKRKGGNQPPTPTCVDGITNGSESDVDCGGTCPRCANNRSCATRNDCAGALCSGGTCHACSVSYQCDSDGNGECYCVTPETGGPRVCVTGTATPDDYVQNCTACPTGTIYCSGPFGPTDDGYLCYMPCGAP